MRHPDSTSMSSFSSSCQPLSKSLRQHFPLAVPMAIAVDRLPPFPSEPRLTTSTGSGIDPSEVLVCDLENKGLLAEDLANALRLWTQPIVLLAGSNSLDRLPANTPRSILYLNLSRNRLTSMEGLKGLSALQELDMSHNGIKDLRGLMSNAELRVLRISHNFIRRVEGLGTLKNLEELDLSHNLLKTKADVRALSLSAALRRLNIEGNSFCEAGVPCGSYKIAVQHLVPGVRLIGGTASNNAQGCQDPPILAAAAAWDRKLGSSPRHAISRSQRGQGPRGAISPGMLTKRNDSSAVGAAYGNSALGGTGGDGIQPTMLPGWSSAQRPESTPSKSITGGGGPPVHPGSYVDIFLASQRVQSPCPAPAPSASTANRAPRAIASSWDGHAPRTDYRQRRAGSSAVGSAPPTQRDKGRRRAATWAAEKQPGGTRCVRAPASNEAKVASPTLGQTRAERAAARRLAWSQARQDGVVGTRSRRLSRGAPSKPHMTAEKRPLQQGRSESPAFVKLRTKAKVSSGRTRRIPESIEDTSIEPPRGHGVGESSAGMYERRATSTKLPGDRRAEARSRARGGDAIPGAKRVVNSAHSSGSPINGRCDGPSCTASRQGRRQGFGRAALSRTHKASGTVGPPEKETSSVDARQGGLQHRYKTTLGRRRRRVSRPTAPPTAPWTPREDAKPWRNGMGISDDLTRTEALPRYLSETSIFRYSAADEESTRCFRSPALTVDRERGVHSREVSDHSDGEMIVHNLVSGEGGRGCDRGISDDPRSVRPFISPLSSTGILKRSPSTAPRSTSFVNGARTQAEDQSLCTGTSLANSERVNRDEGRAMRGVRTGPTHMSAHHPGIRSDARGRNNESFRQYHMRSNLAWEAESGDEWEDGSAGNPRAPGPACKESGVPERGRKVASGGQEAFRRQARPFLSRSSSAPDILSVGSGDAVSSDGSTSCQQHSRIPRGVGEGIEHLGLGASSPRTSAACPFLPCENSPSGDGPDVLRRSGQVTSGTLDAQAERHTQFEPSARGHGPQRGIHNQEPVMKEPGEAEGPPSDRGERTDEERPERGGSAGDDSRNDGDRDGSELAREGKGGGSGGGAMEDVRSRLDDSKDRASDPSRLPSPETHVRAAGNASSPLRSNSEVMDMLASMVSRSATGNTIQDSKSCPA